ncbi:unnamed protein product [Macrosiphum euphorbiae]|uniref:Reverse transcriptase n=1 Tax=Macrosiphum euphorbiae TaxID=13131 RepID=A0AAV0WH83_9HEMI|nr:unnamed protein product [Macrosiphum euphorbiae]
MPAAFKRENPEVKCYNCQLLGHIARDCPQPRRPLKCSKCKAEGHTAKYCTTRSPDIALVEQNQTDNRTVYIKDVYLNNSTDAIKGLVDTGSTLTIIRRSLAERYGMDITPRKIQLRVYGNIPCVIGSGDTEAEVRIDTVSEKIKLLVVEDHMQNFDIIIGRTFINCANVSFIKTADQLIFAYDMPLPFTNEPDEALSEQRPFTPVTVHELHEIPAASVKMVEVDVNSAIVEVLMVNHGDEPVQLKKGTQVKRLHMAVQQSGPSQPYEEPITREKVKYNPHFTEHEVTQLINLLTEYRKCFAFNMFEVGCTKAITMDIVDNNVPVNSKPYRASAQERDTIDRIVREWKAAGIVRESESPYASPVLLVTKKSGEPRLVVDYRKLNSQTVRKVYPTPNMDDHLEVLTGAKMFCTLDLASGYLQVPLTEEAKAKTSFITPTEKGECERMVFGLINAPYEFSRLMEKVMQHLERDVAMWYLDDILIPARSFEEMMIRLRKVLDALSSASLTLKLEKCHFGYEEVTYLGFRLSTHGIKPGEDKAAAILKIEHPTNRHEVRRFLGLTGFFRRFVPQYAQIAKPLTELTKNSVPFEWGHSQQEAFDTLKVKLTSNPVLQLFNPNACTELHCDASQQGLSGLLLQRRNEDKLLHLVYAVSKKTTTAERNYHAGKLELMAIVWSVTRLRHLLIGMQFIIVTDCQAIVHLNTKKTVNPQVARWANLLSEYNYEIRHRPGIKMAHADALSRAPVNTSTDTEVELEELEIMITMTAEEHIITMQRSDENICSLIKIMTKSTED